MPTPTEQLLSRTVYATDGATTIWDFSFSGGYLATTHVKAYTETPLGLRTEITVTAPMLVGPYQLEITPALAAGDILTIYRDTPKNLPLVDFTDESGFSEVSLDTNAKQAVFIAAESADIISAVGLSAMVEARAAAVLAAAQATASAFAAASSAVASASSAGTSSAQAAVATAQATIAAAAAAAAALSKAAAEQAAVSANDSQTAAAIDAGAAQAARSGAELAANAAATAAGSASLIIASGLGFTAATLYDFGYVVDPNILFPTDFGTV